MIQAKFENVEPAIYMDFLKNDTRNCKSNNMQKFFAKHKNYYYCNVIMFDRQMWFVGLGWDNDGKGFAGVRVVEVACKGAKAETCYPSWQHPSKWGNITKEFWDKYMADGIIAFPEIWHISLPKKVKHLEAHAI